VRRARPQRSPLFAQFLAQWAQVRDEYEDYRLSAYEEAAEACRGSLLNARGRALGIDSLSLFMGNQSRAYAYASAELLDHWATHPRVTFAQFEAQRAPEFAPEAAHGI
jgi:hypothetical protein